MAEPAAIALAEDEADSPPPIDGGDPPEVSLQNPNHYAGLGLRGLRRFLAPLLAEVAPAASSFTVRFTSDRHMAELNRRFRHKEGATDVLSFPGDLDASAATAAPFPGEDEDEAHLGDVVIAVPWARRQARRHGHDLAREVRVLVLHGALHCLGYDHETDDGTMERLEDELRGRFLAEEGSAEAPLAGGADE